MTKEEEVMKILKIADESGLYTVDGENYTPIGEINKEDLLKLVDLALEHSVDIDDFDGDLIKNKAHQIIYKSISQKLKSLCRNKDSFKDESDRQFLEAYEKYQQELS